MAAAVVEWLSSWLREQGVWASIPRLATSISDIGSSHHFDFRDWLSTASKHPYDCKIVKMMQKPLKQPTKYKIRNE